MRKENIKLSIIILLVVVVSLSATYAYLELSDSHSSATGTGGCFEVNYQATEINAAALRSTTNENYKDGASSTITLSRNANCEIYTEAYIYLHTNSVAANIKAPLCTEAYLDENPNHSSCSLRYKIVKVEGETETLLNEGSIMDVEDQLLTTVDLTEVETLYKVYIWINSETSKGTYNKKTYSGYLYASSSQSSTIK